MSKSSKISEKTPAKKSGAVRLVLLLLLSVLVSVGTTLFLAAPHVVQTLNPFAASHAAAPPVASELAPAAADTQEEAPPAEVATPVFLELEPFTAMLRDGQHRRRVLYVGLTLRLASEEDKALLAGYMPEVRDRVLRMLSLQDPVDVMPLEGRTRLAQELTSILSVPYHPRLPSPRIDKVLFTAFVVH